MSLPITFEKIGNFPPTYCFTTYDKLAQDIVDILGGEVEGEGSFFTFGPDTPSSVNRDRPWFRTFPNGSPDRFYVFTSGLWIARHELPPSGDLRQLWVGTEAALKTYQGGADEAISDVSGPFWEIDPDFAGRVPIGPGTMESTLVIGVGDTGGFEKVSLAVDELPPHRHPIGVSGAGIANEGDDVIHQGNSNTIQYVENQTQPNVAFTRNEGGDDADPPVVVPHQNLPPYVGTYIIKRTARVFYTV